MLIYGKLFWFLVFVKIKYKYIFPARRELESTTNGLTPPPTPFQLGNTSFLSQETSLERQGLYSQLVNSYKWIDKVYHFLYIFLK